MSGDARRALNICRRATELAQNCQGSGGGGGGLVGLKDIEAAVTEMFTSPKIRAMRLRSSVCMHACGCVYVGVCMCACGCVYACMCGCVHVCMQYMLVLVICAYTVYLSIHMCVVLRCMVHKN